MRSGTAAGTPRPRPPARHAVVGVDEAVLVDRQVRLEAGRSVAPGPLGEALVRLPAEDHLERRKEDPGDGDLARLADRQAEPADRQGVRRRREAEVAIEGVGVVDDDRAVAGPATLPVGLEDEVDTVRADRELPGPAGRIQLDRVLDPPGTCPPRRGPPFRRGSSLQDRSSAGTTPSPARPIVAREPVGSVLAGSMQPIVPRPVRPLSGARGIIRAALRPAGRAPARLTRRTGACSTS